MLPDTPSAPSSGFVLPVLPPQLTADHACRRLFHSVATAFPLVAWHDPRWNRLRVGATRDGQAPCRRPPMQSANSCAQNNPPLSLPLLPTAPKPRRAHATAWAANFLFIPPRICFAERGVGCGAGDHVVAVCSCSLRLEGEGGQPGPLTQHRAANTARLRSARLLCFRTNS